MESRVDGPPAASPEVTDLPEVTVAGNLITYLPSETPQILNAVLGDLIRRDWYGTSGRLVESVESGRMNLELTVPLTSEEGDMILGNAMSAYLNGSL